MPFVRLRGGIVLTFLEASIATAALVALGMGGWGSEWG
jgi:hypothetical protein